MKDRYIETRYALYIRISQPHIEGDPIKNEASVNHSIPPIPSLRHVREMRAEGVGIAKRGRGP